MKFRWYDFATCQYVYIVEWLSCEMREYRVAVVVQGKMAGGGVTNVARFLLDTIKASDQFTVELVLPATSYKDSLSRRIMRPGTWFHSPAIEVTEWNGIKAYHVGVNVTELEFQRYMPSKRLTALLNTFDIIQVVSGSPALAYLARDVSVPVTLFVATLTRLERSSLMKSSSSVQQLNNTVMMPIVSQIETRALRLCDHVFAETAYTRQAILPHIDDDKVSIDTASVDVHRFHPIAEENRTDDYILSVGRFADARKNVGMLIEAYALLRQQMPDAPKLVLAGKTGPNDSHWERARQLGVDDHIEVKIGVSLDELVVLYQNAAVYALSSDEEGLGIVLLEAMACATPVVATRCGGPDSVVSDAVGFLTPVGNAEAMADQLLWMLKHPQERRMMGQAGRKMVEERFSKEVVGQKYLRVYRQLLKL